MAFIINQNGDVLSFAEYADVTAKDQRLFEANEGLTEEVVEDALSRSTERILTIIRGSQWWRDYYLASSTNLGDLSTQTFFDVPSPIGSRIQARRPDFTDLCVYYALSEILYPKIADFGNADTAERQKIGFYDEKFRKLLEELLNAGDWYNFDGEGEITNREKRPSRQNIVRVR